MAWGMAAAAGLGALASSQSDGGSSTRKTKRQIPDWLREPTERTVNRAEEAIQGDFFADIQPSQEEGLALQEALARDLERQQAGQGAIGLGQASLQGDFLMPSSNPFLQANIEAAQQPVIEQFQEQELPGITSESVSAGQMGSSRQGVLEANALDDLTQNLSNTAAQMVAQNYGRERELQQQAPQLIQQGMALRQTPATMLQSTGEQRQALEERQLQEDFRKQQEFANLLSSVPSGRTSTTTQMQNPDPLAQAFKGGLGAASMWSNAPAMNQTPSYAGNTGTDLFGSARPSNNMIWNQNPGGF